MNNLILFTTENGRSQIKLQIDLGTVWLIQLEMAGLFQTIKQNIAKHLKAIFTKQELIQDSVVNQRLTTAVDGKNQRVADFRVHPTSILYTACREFLSPTQLGNCQGMLDSSGIKTLPWKQPANDQFAARCVANSIDSALEATTEETSVVHMRAIQRCEVSGVAIGQNGSATS